MKAFRDFSIKRKLMLIIMLISIVALILSCALFLSYDRIIERRELVSDLTTQAEMIGNNSTAVPIVTRWVRAATAAAMGNTEGRYSSSMKWCSVSQTVSKPRPSTASM